MDGSLNKMNEITIGIRSGKQQITSTRMKNQKRKKINKKVFNSSFTKLQPKLDQLLLLVVGGIIKREY